MLNSSQKNDEIFLDVDCFSKMKNLKIFINYDVCLYGDYLPNTLRVLDWYGCPLQSFPPNFRPRNLAVLEMPYNNIKQLGSLKHFKKLTSLNLSRSKFLTAIPDLSASPNIKSLDASECTSLVEVHPSVGYLDKLQELNFYGCRELTKFPNKVWWKSLESLDLGDCRKLESFPEIVDKMESLNQLDLYETSIKELPASIGHLIGLKDLNLYGTPIKELPYSIGHLTALEELNLSRTAIEELPASIGHLTALQQFRLEECENLASLPQSIYGLQNVWNINLNECPKLVTLPNNLISQVLSSADPLRSVYFSMQECNVSDINSLENCCWLTVGNIELCKSNFVSFNMCLSKFVNLWKLDLSGCKKLVEIVVQLPASIESINVADCRSLERFSTLSKILEDGDMQHIYNMDLSNCHRLCNIGLDAAKMAKILVNYQRKPKGPLGVNVLLPGSEVPEWFSFRQDVGVLLPDSFQHSFDFRIEIPWTSLFENKKLILCTVWEITESFIGPCIPHMSFKIDGEHFAEYERPVIGSVSEGETGESNVGLHTSISFPAPSKSISRILTVSCRNGEGLLFKSFGAHLSRSSMPKNGFGFRSMPKDGDDGKNDENELDDDDDVGDYGTLWDVV